MWGQWQDSLNVINCGGKIGVGCGAVQRRPKVDECKSGGGGTLTAAAYSTSICSIPKESWREIVVKWTE